MRNNPGRVIIDTNIFISFLITKDFAKLNDIIFSKKYVLIFSDELIREIVDVTRRPKFRRFFSLLDIEDLLVVLFKHRHFVNVKTEVNACRDPKGNCLLSLAIDGEADFLLTGDNDLLVLGKFGQTDIVTIKDFLKSAE